MEDCIKRKGDKCCGLQKADISKSRWRRLNILNGKINFEEYRMRIRKSMLSLIEKSV